MGSAHSKWSRIRSYLDSTTTRRGFVDGSSRMVKFWILRILTNILGKPEVDQIANLAILLDVRRMCVMIIEFSEPKNCANTKHVLENKK